MKYEEIKKLIENVIENEFMHVQEYDEKSFLDTDKEQIELTKTSNELLGKLNDSIPEEYQKSLNEYNDALISEWVNMCSFYFKEGVKAGTTNLEFLKETKLMSYI